MLLVLLFFLHQLVKCSLLFVQLIVCLLLLFFLGCRIASQWSIYWLWMICKRLVARHGQTPHEITHLLLMASICL